jgi:lysyl-tRNA synthetase class 1
MHWVDVIAQKLIARSKTNVIASGTSISGTIHLGNAGDIIMADAVKRAVNELGGNAKLIWVMDDVDPLRKLPEQLPADFDTHIGKPDFMLPCPFDCCQSFVAHFTGPFIDALHELGVYPEIISSAKMYKNGEYDTAIKTAIERVGQIRAILKNISGSVKSDDWLPFDPICEQCGKITPTRAYSYENGKVRYRCEGGIAGKQYVDGCGYDGFTSIRNGKLTWRVEWAARWKILGVTCEPFGKEHAAAGGSYDTSAAIVQDVFAYPPPYPVRYEHILVAGQKMSKSVGNVIRVEDMIEVAPTELVKFLFFRVRPTAHKEFDLTKSLLHLMEDYERIERIYYGIEKPTMDQDELADLRRTYELSQIDKPGEQYFQVPFTHLVSLVQIDPNWENILTRLKRTYGTTRIDQMSKAELTKLKTETERVKRWVELYAPAHLKFSVQPKLPQVKLTTPQQELLKELASYLESIHWDAESIHRSVYAVIERIKINKKAAFQALYLVLLGQAYGPRLGYFLAAMGRNFVIQRLREASLSA